MKDRVIKACENIQQDLCTDDPGLRHVLENDHLLEDKLDHFKNSLTAPQKAELEGLMHELNLARRYARTAALKLSSEGQEEQDGLSEKLEEVKQLTHTSESYDKAVVEIARQAHRHSGRPLDVLKSLFMWKDSPQ